MGRAALPATELRRGVVEYCVLSVLATGEQYGYELVRRLADFDGIVTSEGTVYPLLARLNESGLVTSNWRQVEGARPRKYYAIAPEGRRALDDFRGDWARFRDLVDHVLALSDKGQ